MIRAIDSQEVQLALRPSPSTGLTVAQTVEWKLKDVNERIVICTRIMGAARFNVSCGSVIVLTIFGQYFHFFAKSTLCFILI